MDTIQINIEASSDQQDILISKLEELGVNGFEQKESLLIAYFNENDFPDYDIKEIIKPFPYHITTIKEQNWNKIWENNFPPVVIADYCSIRADFHEPAQNVPLEIVINPKMSFGTGHHATTHMMVKAMKDLNFKGKKVLDFGTGTGILAILAEKSGASKVVATDIDHWSIENAGENAKKNLCTKIYFKLTDEIPDNTFDIILANINRNVLLGYLILLKPRLNSEGYLLISGILNSDERDLIEACNILSLKFLKKEEKDNWISLLFIN